VTTTGPLVAPAGTGTTMVLALQLVGVAAVPLNRTTLVPFVVPKFAPLMVTVVPTLPDVGDRLAMMGAFATMFVETSVEYPLRRPLVLYACAAK